MDTFPSSTPPSQSHDALERITLQMASCLDLQLVLTTITQGLVDELDGAFARIWLLGPGDLCAGCYKAADCTNRDRCLHLETNAGLYTNLNGEYRYKPTARCYLGYVAMTQILEAMQRAGSTDTAGLINALEGHEFDGLKEGRSYFRSGDHQHVQDVLVGEAYGKVVGLGHDKILTTVPGDAVARGRSQHL